VSTPLAQPATKTFERHLQFGYWNWAKKYKFYKKNTLDRALLLLSRVSKVEFQSFIFKTGAGRAIETICETTVCYRKINRILDNRKERSITVQRIGCELEDQEVGVWFSAVAISSLPQHPHRLLDTFSVVALSSFPGRVAICSSLKAHFNLIEKLRVSGGAVTPLHTCYWHSI